MGYDTDSQPREEHDEDDEDEYEEESGGNRLLGFMFGNVDDSGDLDADYLDEDAKEHLAAVADKLGTSLTDIELSVRSLKAASDATDEDYDEKAENAVNYEDIDEQYEGPEVQAATEEDFLLPKKDFLSTAVSVSTLVNTTSVYGDENYDDEDDDTENQNTVSEGNMEAPSIPALEDQKVSYESDSQDGNAPENMHIEVLETENLDVIEPDEDDSDSSEDLAGDDRSSLLPILCVEDGKAILRFSEIFGIQQPIKKSRKRESRYILPKDKYISMDASDTVEEDEEAFFKAPFQDLPWRMPFCLRSENGMLDDRSNSVTSRMVSGTRKISVGLNELKKDSCVSAEPMKEGASKPTFSEWNHMSPNLYSLDQQDWEEQIIWSNSPSNSENFVVSCEMSGPDSDGQADVEMDFEVATRARACDLRIETEPQDKDHSSFLNTRAISLEPFGANENSHSISSVVTDTRRHPQLLRLDSRFEDDTDTAGAKDKDNGGETKLFVDSLSHFSQLTLQNRDVLEGSWLDEIIWETNQSVMKPKLLLDLQDGQMLFELSDTKEADYLQLHAGAMIISRSAIPSGGDSLELYGHGVPAAGRFNISNDKFYSNRKISQQLRSHSKKRAIHGLKVWHSAPALKLETMKAKLSNKDVANFHRPKALWYPHDIEVPLMEHRLAMQGPMKIIVKSLGGRGSKFHVDAEETISSVKAKASKKLDFKPSELIKIVHGGRELEDSKSLAEQNVHPNSVLHLIRTKIHLLPRAQKLPGENKSLRPPGAFKKKSDLSVKDGRVFLMEYCEERPLLLGNAGMGARICTYYQKSTPGDQMGNVLRNENSGLGQVCILDTTDKSPFLGDIKPGSSQSCIETNMYRAPLFPHKVPSTDYLLVRSPKGKLSIRRIDRVHVVGQQEPHMEVMSPGSKNLQSYIMNRLLVYMYREFRASEKRGLQPSIRHDDLCAQFPSLPEANLRKRLKNCADLQKGFWVMKRNFRIPSEEELRRMVPPENVCSYESMQAGLYRLKRLGITKLTLPTGLSAAMNQLPDEAIALAAASHIERELQITPWNLSSNFVSCTNQNRENLERLEISGVGDPSGRGLGFSYVRTTPKAPVANSVVRKKTVVAKGSTVTGTDADLRRLSMDQARECILNQSSNRPIKTSPFKGSDKLLLKFNVPDDHIGKLTRWHRIAEIRKLSSDQAASGVKVDPTTVSKYARGQRMSFLQLQQQTREKFQEIWDRQFQSLCYAEVEENENESEANSDLDSFAGDLENLLDAEEGEEDHADSKNDIIDGVKGLKMRRRPLQTQAEEEIEDEAAEAAELCRMLMDEEEADQKKKKTGAVVKQVGLAFKSNFGPENADGINKNNPVTKRTVQRPADSFSSRDNIMNDQKEEESIFSKRQQPGKLKVKKKNEIENTGLLNKKVKILADGMNVIKEKKSAREIFVCGACRQFGHMRTNKQCPMYGVDSETRGENTDFEKSLGRTGIADQAESSQPKLIKKLIPKTSRSAAVDIPEDDKPNLKAKVLKVKCSGTDKLPDKPTPTTSQNSDRLMMDGETSNRSAVKVNKIVFSKKNKADDIPVEPQKPSIVIKPPVEGDRDQPRKKIIIKQPKEIINLDENSQDGSFGFDYRKTKKIVELSGLDSHHEDVRQNDTEETSRTRDLEGNQWWMEDQRRNAEMHQEERHRRSMKSRMVEEQPKLQILMYEEAIREEREEEAIRKEIAKKKKKKRPEVKVNYLEDLPPRRNDRRIAEKERPRKRPAVELGRHASEYGQASKRRRGGEVGLSNILDGIVETLRRNEVSYLFLKPVAKKEAPDYYDIIERPMDLSKIRDKARRLQYKHREEFRHDVYLIAYNAHMYNDGRNPGIPPLADQLLELCDYMLDQHDAVLTEAESGIE